MGRNISSYFTNNDELLNETSFDRVANGRYKFATRKLLLWTVESYIRNGNRRVQCTYVLKLRFHYRRSIRREAFARHSFRFRVGISVFLIHLGRKVSNTLSYFIRIVGPFDARYYETRGVRKSLLESNSNTESNRSNLTFGISVIEIVPVVYLNRVNIKFHRTDRINSIQLFRRGRGLNNGG